eukprot:276581-Pyramimonas_sp.AAC.1
MAGPECIRNQYGNGCSLVEGGIPTSVKVCLPADAKPSYNDVIIRASGQGIDVTRVPAHAGRRAHQQKAQQRPDGSVTHGCQMLRS